MWLQRIFLSLGGSVLGAFCVALLELRTERVVAPGEGSFGLLLGSMAVLSPLALLLGFGVGLGSLLIHAARPYGPLELAEDLRLAPVLRRTRLAAAAPLAILLTFIWCVTMAQVARVVLSRGTPRVVAAELGMASLVLLGVLLSLALALLPWLRRTLARGAEHLPRLVDPVTTGGTALGLTIALFTVGIFVGDTNGNGPTPLSIFGVFKRGELDLKPVFHLIILLVAAYGLPLVATSSRQRLLRGAAAFVCVVAGCAVTVLQATRMTDPVAMAIERGGPLGKSALKLARNVTDRDRDGYSALFAGGDCNDRDPKINPAARDIPGNGIDEDCSGADAPIVLPPRPTSSSTPAVAKKFIDRDLNLVLITVDTLRIDVSFMGFKFKTTPNLEKLANKSVVYDRMYALASYTSRSLPPALIGKYPSETTRDGGHFTKYGPENVFLAERLKTKSIFTMGVPSHWYFDGKFGWTQGMDLWDMGAATKDSASDKDETTTSHKVTDTAIKHLSNASNVSKQFFMWVHYFDPHAEFMPHPEAPNFLDPDRKMASGMKAAYDAEVWYTDKHVGRLLDFIDSQPWGKDTAIIVTSDHGELFAEHNMSYHGFEIWELLVRVPFIVYVPGVEPHRVAAKRSHVDLVPTALDLMRVPQPQAGELSGESLVPDLASKQGHPERDVYIDMPAGPHTRMRRALIYGPGAGMKLIQSDGRSWSLYDLANDPNEEKDLSSDKDKLAEAKRLFEAKRATVREIDVRPDSQ